MSGRILRPAKSNLAPTLHHRLRGPPVRIHYGTRKFHVIAITITRTSFSQTGMWKAQSEVLSLIQTTTFGGRDGTMTTIHIYHKLGRCQQVTARLNNNKTSLWAFH